jgi:alanyl-tRNA synthetase
VRRKRCADSPAVFLTCNFGSNSMLRHPVSSVTSLQTDSELTSLPLASQPYLSKIQIMHVLPTTASKPSPKPTRLYMVAGARAHRHLLQASKQLTTTSIPLGCARNEVAMRVAQREEQRKEATRLEGRLREALARAEGRAISWKQDAEGVWKAKVERSEESTHDFEFMQSLANYAQDHLINEIATSSSSSPTQGKDSSSPSFVLIVVSNPDPVWLNKTHQAGGAFLQITSNPPDLAKQAGDGVKLALDGLGVKGRVKGGGAKGKFMGKVTGGWSARDADAAKDVVGE